MRYTQGQDHALHSLHMNVESHRGAAGPTTTEPVLAILTIEIITRLQT